MRSLVPIDDAPIRARQAGATHRLLVRYVGVRRQLAEFATRDKPAFGRWLAAEFRALMAEAESLQARLARARGLAERVEEVRERDRSSYRKAYKTALEEELSGLRDDSERAEEDLEDDAADEPDLEQAAGADADAPEDESESETEGDVRRFDRDRVDWTRFVDGAERPGGRPVSPEESARDRYRKIVRLLHPDARAGHRSDAVKVDSIDESRAREASDRLADDLWHQAQAAFKEKDAEQLGAILSIARLRFGDRRDAPFVGEVLSAAAWLREALSRLSAEVRIAKRDDAWGFSKLKDRLRLKRKIEYQLEDDIADMRGQIARYESMLRKWAETAERPRRPSARARPSS